MDQEPTDGPHCRRTGGTVVEPVEPVGWHWDGNITLVEPVGREYNFGRTGSRTGGTGASSSGRQFPSPGGRSEPDEPDEATNPISLIRLEHGDPVRAGHIPGSVGVNRVSAPPSPVQINLR